MSTIPQNEALIKQLGELLGAHRPLYRQKRVYGRVVGLLLGEVVAFGRHTVTQLVWVLGMSGVDWSAWYRVFSRGYFQEEASARVVLGESLRHVGAEEVYVVAGDGTQTARSSGKMEGVGWQRNMRTPVFMVGIHWAQRWFNGRWLIPAENGYSRAVPLRWMPAFTEKAKRQVQAACTEWKAAVQFLGWLKVGLAALGRPQQRVLMVADGSYDTLAMWQHLPAGVWLLVRSAKNRVLHHLPPVSKHGNRKYGERALTP